MPRRLSRSLLVCALVVTAVTACTPALVDLDTPTPTVSATPTPSPTPTARPSPSTGGTADLGRAVEERDAFIRDQRQPIGANLLSAKTPSQRDFISQQRRRAEKQGVVWSAEAESASLAVTLDACETSILSGHRVTAEVFRTHVATDPLFPRLTGGDPQKVSGLATTMVFGTTFLCPADSPDWQAAFDEVFGASQRT